MANRFPLIFNSGAGQIQELAASDNLDLTSSNLVNAGILFTSLGSAAAPSLAFTGDSNTGIFSPGADQVAISTNGTERLRITSAGLVGIGTSSPATTLDVNGALQVTGTVSGYIAGEIRLGSAASGGQSAISTQATGASVLYFHHRGTGNTGQFEWANGTGASNTMMVLNSSGRLGIGTTVPTSSLQIGSGSGLQQAFISGGGYDLLLGASGGSAFGFLSQTASLIANNTSVPLVLGTLQSQPLVLGTANSERARIDTSGRLLVGTSSLLSDNWSGSNESIQTAKSGLNTISILAATAFTPAHSSYFALNRARGTLAVPTIVSSGDALGGIYFSGYDGSTYLRSATIDCVVDAAPGANDMPSRLVFSTTADGAASPTERMRINSDGGIVGGGNAGTYNLFSSPGFSLSPGSAAGSFNGLSLSKSSSIWGTALYIHRTFGVGDGTLVEFAHATVTEGAISVSGTTVTYGGGHLARWSQLPNNEDPSEILKGTVMSNLDEMCEWGEEDNEQLNKTKVSDVEGDPNVAGVFVSTSFSEDGPLDFYVGMTGDMVLRIAEGVTVERGDLLMSAGDGTAKPQDDDIIRSKTIAKVTSTNVSCTYEDGSYCVPCVLMAC